MTIENVKGKLSLCFNWAPRHEGVLGEWKYSSTHSLTSGLGGGEWSASRPGRSTPRERAPGTHYIGGWMGSRAVLDAVVKRKFPSPRRESKPRAPTIVNCSVFIFVCYIKKRALFESVFRTRCWVEYLDLWGRKKYKTGENCITKKFMVCTLYEILLCDEMGELCNILGKMRNS
jgi:hypothetical protein